MLGLKLSLVIIFSPPCHASSIKLISHTVVSASIWLWIQPEQPDTTIYLRVKFQFLGQSSPYSVFHQAKLSLPVIRTDTLKGRIAIEPKCRLEAESFILLSD